MSRLKTQPDADPTSIKLAMIHSNINRINTQNNKLQQLLFLTPQLNQLKDVVGLANSNWEKIAALAEKVHQLHQQAVNMRNVIHCALEKHGEQVTRGLLGEIQNCKGALLDHEHRLREAVGRSSAKSKQDGTIVRKKVA